MSVAYTGDLGYQINMTPYRATVLHLGVFLSVLLLCKLSNALGKERVSQPGPIRLTVEELLLNFGVISWTLTGACIGWVAKLYIEWRHPNLKHTCCPGPKTTATIFGLTGFAVYVLRQLHWIP
jgi:hypothetical protein